MGQRAISTLKSAWWGWTFSMPGTDVSRYRLDLLSLKHQYQHSAAVFSPPLILFSALSAVMFLLLLVLFWRHNQSAYKRLYSQWERSSHLAVD
ncbi:MAG: hypothetical protein DMG40_02335 [Acidobacteria bacterium]|nr:MAG: hypothetical protein DMG40_02335 [Acidobacteriota bacterium]